MQFKQLSIQNFPEVSILQFPINLSHMKTWVTEMDFLLEKHQDFVLIYPLFDPTYFKKVELAELKACRKMALEWFQNNRRHLKEKCRGIILPIKEDNSDLPIIEIHREELESFYRIPTEILYRPQDLSMLSHALIHDAWDIATNHSHLTSNGHC